MKPLCILNVVGLTPELLRHAPTISAVGQARPWASPTPAVTTTCQATMLTGKSPREHGIVGNGWYFRDTQEIRFWQQANSLIESDKLYDGIETAKMFWWFNQGSRCRYWATPKPHYGCDGSKVFDIIDETGCGLTNHLGPFPFFSFWGPAAGLPASDWIADATALVMRQQRPQLTLCYLPHLDYDFQRSPDHDPARVAEVDAAAARVIEAADQVGARVVVVSEYGLTPASRPVHLNRILRQSEMLGIRRGPFGEMLMPGESEAFAVADHQVAHVYVRDSGLKSAVRRVLESAPGVAAVVEPAELELDHPRSGELIVLAEPDAWFTYYYWEDDRNAPDFARTVDIHRKPGYDPVELFMTSRFRAYARVAQKLLGLRYRMDVIPLDARLVRGSHGLPARDPESGPLILGPSDGPELPDDMRGFRSYCQRMLE
ncbi:MAG: nucleotide pyrophosphatase/phosphodiesterase family protein [Planctomycetota bacterium]